MQSCEELSFIKNYKPLLKGLKDMKPINKTVKNDSR